MHILIKNQFFCKSFDKPLVKKLNILYNNKVKLSVEEKRQRNGFYKHNRKTGP